MTQFYNPYQFVPLRKPEEEQLRDYKDIAAGQDDFIRHDRWDENALSGRICCRLETISPLVVGACQTKGDKEVNTPGEVEPYREGQRLPANSLRGMIASVAESISNSALRVLSKKEEHEYSVRKPPRQALKKIGLLLKEDHGWALKPMPEFFPLDRRSLSGKHSYQHNDHPQPYSWNGRQYIYYLRGWHKDMPNKKKEYACDWAQAERAIESDAALPVRAEAVEALNRELARGMEDNPEFPYLPVGYRGASRNGKSGFVKSGDLVYYREQNGQVVEISYSAIWRKPVGNLYDAISKIDANLLPWNPGRKELTPAEALFGVIEKGADGGRIDDHARNLASRLRFHDAKAEAVVELPEEPQTLKILASPKPPSPSLYFREPGGGYVSKQDLDLSKHAPNGRKRYLPHPGWQNTGQGGEKYWETRNDENNHQKLKARPIPAETTYRFHIDFENLSAAELTLLRRAIEPGEGFQHQLGLGKPLGLGQVKVVIEGMDFIDRSKRYSLAGWKAPRYSDSVRFEEDQSLLDWQALDMVLHLGRPGSLVDERTPVCYPFDETVRQRPYNETEGFKWFVTNEKVRPASLKQHMKGVEAPHRLPTLESLHSIRLSLSIRGRGPGNIVQQIKGELARKWPDCHVDKVDLRGREVVLLGREADISAVENSLNDPFEFDVGDAHITVSNT